MHVAPKPLASKHSELTTSLKAFTVTLRSELTDCFVAYLKRSAHIRKCQNLSCDRVSAVNRAFGVSAVIKYGW